MAVQWANSPKEVDEENKTLMYKGKVNPKSLKAVSERGKVELALPKKARHFRVLVWTQGTVGPDLTTNWIDIEPNKTYTLETDYLTPVELMPGVGC